MSQVSKEFLQAVGRTTSNRLKQIATENGLTADDAVMLALATCGAMAREQGWSMGKVSTQAMYVWSVMGQEGPQPG